MELSELVENSSGKTVSFEKKGDPYSVVVSDGYRCTGYTYTTGEGEEVFVAFKDVMYNRYNSYAISVSVIEELQNEGVKKLFIVSEDFLVYEFKIETYLNAKVGNDCDPQYAPPITDAETVHNEISDVDYYPEKFEIAK